MAPRSRFTLILLAVGLVFASVARANDGQLEINQSSVAAAGGFPLVLSQPGSYRLTGNLVVSGATGAIQATVDGVWIDLGGFSISGPGSCSATLSGVLLQSVDCTGNAGTGIDGAESVRNGIVRGFEIGIRRASDEPLQLNAVVAIENSYAGAQMHGAGIVTDSRFERNGSYGLEGQTTTSQLVVRSSVFRRNKLYGLYVGSGSVDGSVFEQNGQGLRSAIGRGSVVTNGFFGRNVTGVAGANIGIRSCTFDENTTNFTATQLGPNLCDDFICP